MFHILRRSTCICLIVVLSTIAIVEASMKRYFYIQIDVPIGNLSPKITQKWHFSSKIGKSGKIGKFLERSRNSFQIIPILKMHFPVKFHPYISVFDKFTAYLILWEFDRGIDAEFHNDVIWRSRNLLINLDLLKKTRKIDF